MGQREGWSKYIDFRNVILININYWSEKTLSIGRRVSVYKLKLVASKVVLTEVLLSFALTELKSLYSGAGKRGSTAVISTLSTSSGINLPSMIPEVYKQGLEFASMRKGVSSWSSIKSSPKS